MAEKSFNVKEIQVQGSGTPTIESPSGGDLNITAATTTFSGAVQASGAFTINSSSTIHVAESSDDNNFYNIPFLTTTGAAGGGRKFQVDNGGLQFNASTNTFFVQNVQLGTGTGSNAAGSLSIFNSSGRKFGEINGIPFGEGNSSNATNIFVGDTTPSSTSSNFNIGIGYQALHSSNGNITNNVAIGYQALLGNNGAYNVAIGDNCLSGTGNYNIGLGRQAGHQIAGAEYNVLLGYQPAFNITDIGHSVAIGYQALYSISDGLMSGASGTGNTYGHIAIGYNSQKEFEGIDQNGQPNIAMGIFSLENNIQSGDNIAIGNFALRYLGQNCTNFATNGGGIGNIAIGSNAMQGGHNGSFSSTDTFRGDYNTAIGWQSLSTLKSATADKNTALGLNSGGVVQTGSENVFLGNNTSASGASVTKEIVMGPSATGKGTRTFFVNSDSGVYHGGNTTTWSTTSDIRIKKNVTDNNTGLDKIKEIQVRNFEYKTKDEITDFENPDAVVVDKEGLQLGVIAQEIQQVLPDIVNEESTGVLSVNADNLTWYLINAVKELSAKNDALEARIKTLEGS